MQNRGQWERQTRRLQSEKGEGCRNSLFAGQAYEGRHRDYLQKFLKPHIESSGLAAGCKDQQMNVLDIGPGYGNPLAEPIELVAIARQLNLYPAVTILDCEGDTEDMGDNSTISHPSRSYSSWTSVTGDNGVIPMPEYMNMVGSAIGAGVNEDGGRVSFDIPSSILSKLAFIKADIAVWEPGDSDLGKFDLIVALNIFRYIYNDDAIALATMNMLKAARVGGVVFVSEQNGEAMFLLSPLIQKELGYKLLAAAGGSFFHALILQKTE